MEKSKMFRLGSQGLEVPAMGLGCMGMTGWVDGDIYGPADEQEAIATIHRSLELGGNFLDTADLYGPFRNERLIAKAIAGKRDQYILASKFGWEIDDNDHDKGVLSFTAPNQVQSLDLDKMECGSGYLLVLHPDFLAKHPLARTITQYGYFSYAVNEALHLSAQEEDDIIALLLQIEKECRHIDRHTQDIVLSQIELLLNYSNRFYERQFFTRKKNNNDLLTAFEQVLNDYFTGSKPEENGLPTVQYLADVLHLSPNYLSDMLRIHTGQNTQQHIHAKLIEKAKEKLSTTALSVSEIAYQLGFEHPQSFSKLFKLKTQQSPVAFRDSFN